MDRMMVDNLELLRRANACLRQFLVQFSGIGVVGTDGEMQALLPFSRMYWGPWARFWMGGCKPRRTTRCVRNSPATAKTWSSFVSSSP